MTLFQNGHGFELGDVNHDGTISILDVTILIDYLLGNAEVCTICADLSGDNYISILDVTMLSDQILSGN